LSRLHGKAGERLESSAADTTGTGEGHSPQRFTQLHSQQHLLRNIVWCLSRDSPWQQCQVRYEARDSIACHFIRHQARQGVEITQVAVQSCIQSGNAVASAYFWNITKNKTPAFSVHTTINKRNQHDIDQLAP